MINDLNPLGPSELTPTLGVTFYFLKIHLLIKYNELYVKTYINRNHFRLAILGYNII